MKTLVKIIGLLLITVFLFASCSTSKKCPAYAIENSEKIVNNNSEI